MKEQVVILDFGSQYTQVIARRIRECKVYSTILPHNTPIAQIAALNPKGIILTGGPKSVYSRKAPLPDKKIFDLGVPVLGICFGLQLMAKYLGGKVERGLKREYGKGELQVKDGKCALFGRLPDTLQVWGAPGRSGSGFNWLAEGCCRCQGDYRDHHCRQQARLLGYQHSSTDVCS